jgi:hypothetical protein
MVELSTAARQGDSGGPIFNRQGELAGVLFGSATGTTSGSFCGRVGQFLHPVMARLEQLEPVAPEQQADGPMIAAESRPTGPVASIRGPSVQWESAAAAPGDAVTQGGGLPPASGFRPSGDAPPAFGADSAAIAASQADGAASGGPAVPAALDAAEAPAANSALVGPTRGDQIKTVLAAIGGLAIVGHLFHLLGRIVES